MFSLLQIYNEYAQASEQLSQEQEENKRLNLQLEQIENVNRPMLFLSFAEVPHAIFFSITQPGVGVGFFHLCDLSPSMIIIGFSSIDILMLEDDYV